MAKSIISHFSFRMVALLATLLLCFACLFGCGSPVEDTSADSSAQIDVMVAVAAYEDGDLAALEKQVQVNEGATVLEASETADIEVVVTDSSYGPYVSSIAGLAAEGSSGWVYTINGESVMEAADKCVLADGDKIEWSYMSW